MNKEEKEAYNYFREQFDWIDPFEIDLDKLKILLDLIKKLDIKVKTDTFLEENLENLNIEYQKIVEENKEISDIQEIIKMKYPEIYEECKNFYKIYENFE